MLLIPFVENAFKHGVALVEDPFIKINLKVVDNTLHFSVENKFSTEASQSKDKDSGIGLANVKARLQLLYPDQYQLSVHQRDEIFSVNLTLPLQ
jgi:sensor histidine kinase YesM